VAGGGCFCCGKWRSVVIASQIEGKTRRSIGFRLCRLRAAVARSRSVAEAAASACGRCTMPPCRCLSCSLVALAVQLVHRWDTPLWLIWQSLKWECAIQQPFAMPDPGTSRTLPLTHEGYGPHWGHVPVDKRGTKCFDLQIPEHAQDPQPATAFLPARIRCTTFCEIPSEINRSMGNLLFWLGIGAAQKSAGSKVVKSTTRQHQRLSIVVGIVLALLISAGAFILLVSQQ
jgi:hypothetical protein